jgi:hypothetical protein
MKTTRQQVITLTELHPSWTWVQIAQNVRPPVSPQRVNQIVNDTKPDFTSEKYREYHRHKYHKKVPAKYKRKSCKYCGGVSFAT